MDVAKNRMCRSLFSDPTEEAIWVLGCWDRFRTISSDTPQSRSLLSKGIHCPGLVTHLRACLKTPSKAR